MLFSLALFSSLLVAPVVLAVPSGLGARVVRRGDSFQSQVNNAPVQGAGVASNSGTVYSNNWAGAVWTEGNGTFDGVTGTFTVPTLSGSRWASAAAWVGIDGNTCTSAIFQTGVSFIVEDDQPIYFAWYEWYPTNAQIFPNIDISAGDVIKLTVTAWSANSGTAKIENLTNGQVASKSLSSSATLCGQNAEWIVEDNSGAFADFGTVTFTNGVATGAGNYYPSGATIFDIRQNGQVLTNVTTSGTSVTIQYL